MTNRVGHYRPSQYRRLLGPRRYIELELGQNIVLELGKCTLRLAM
jgi:hypothetical protein